MAGAALRIGLPLVLVLVVPAALLRGAGAALTAGFVVVLVVGLFALTGLAHGWAATRGLVTFQAVVMGGLFLRLSVYAVLLVTLHPTDLLDPIVLAITTPIVVLTLLAYEVRFVSSRPEFLFLDTTARAGTDRKDRA